MKLITAPSAPVITTAEAKAHLRVTHSAEDTLIESLVKAATGWLDGWTGILGKALMPQTWEVPLDAFPRGCIRLPLGPAVSVTSVNYLDSDGAPQTVAPENYTLSGGIITGTWPYGTGVKIQYVAGEGCPEEIKMVVKLLIGHWYENREAVGDRLAAVPMAVDMLIAPHRRVGV